MVKYIFHTSLWSHFSLTNLPSHFIVFLCENRSEGVYSERRFRLSNCDENLSNVLGEKNEKKMRDELLLILFYHLISLSQSLPLLAFIRALVADERGERKKNMRWDGWFSYLSHNLPSHFLFFRHEGVWIIIIWVQKKASLLPSQV